MLSKALFQFISWNCDFSKFWCGLGEDFPTLSKGAFKVITLFQNNYLRVARLSLMMNIKHIDLN